MVGLEENIRVFAEEFLEGSEYFVVDVVRGSVNKRTKISVFLDADTSVSIDKCADVSRYVTGKVEEEMDFDDAYVIEVSSAGLDKPLTMKRQYVKNIGREVEVVKLDGEKLTGVLREVGDDEVKLEIKRTKKKPAREEIIKNNNIKSTKVKISF